MAPLTGRDPGEEHRTATPLELFFDLVFVVAVTLAADRLHNGLAAGAVGQSVLRFTLVFFAVYWAWVNFTWFASAYDSDDVAYRLFVFVTMVGALVFAAGVPQAFDDLDFRVTTVGYAVMRVSLVVQWVRVARAESGRRRLAAQRFAIGLTALQVGWAAVLALPRGWYVVAWLLLSAGELLVPMWAEAAAPTRWHREHIAERYGLFMIIVLGESVLAASTALQAVLNDGGLTRPMVPVLVGALLIVFSVWWTYFERPGDHLLSTLRTAFVWSYLHLVVFASVAAIGAGLVVAIEGVEGGTALGPAASAATTAVPFAVYLVSLWMLNVRADVNPVRRYGLPVTAALVLASPFLPSPILLTGVAVTALLALKTTHRVRAGAGSGETP